MTGPPKPTPPNPTPRHAAAQRQDSSPPAPATRQHSPAPPTHPASRESAPPQSPPLILASASPRRQSLLREAGYVFITYPSDIDESEHPPDLSPEQLARFLAQRKARAVAAEFPKSIILAADTVVAIPSPRATPRRSRRIPPPPKPTNIILGKPTDASDARRILKLLSGTTHSVITAVAILRRTPPVEQITAVESTVHMRELTDQELAAYLATGNWQGKAGAYGIQDNDPFVTRITGCHTNIVGLPMTTTKALLAQSGIHPISPHP